MYQRMELIIDSFYKTYYKIEEINLSLVIKCLTTTELHIIECIGLDKLSIKELSEKLGITMGTTSVAINKLEDKGFIQRSRSKTDKRKVYVFLTKKGQIAFNYHGNFHSTTLERVTKNIPIEKLEAFIETFEDILKNMKSLKLNLEPENLNFFNKGDIIEVSQVKGNSVIRLALSKIGIQLKTIIEIIEIHKDSLRIKINGLEKLISKQQASYILGIKKELNL